MIELNEMKCLVETHKNKIGTSSSPGHAAECPTRAHGGVFRSKGSGVMLGVGVVFEGYVFFFVFFFSVFSVFFCCRVF